MRHHILISGKLHPIALEHLSQAKDITFDNKPDLPHERILEIIGNYHAIISRSETRINAELLDQGTRLKVVARAAVGVGNIDLEYASQKGVLVINCPGLNTTSAAELAVGLMLAAARRIPLAHHAMTHQRWERHRFSGIELQGKTIGIIGLGNVGSQVARIATGMGMRVLAYDPYLPETVFDARHASKMPLKEMLKESDVVSLHTPLNHETRGMLSEQLFLLLKAGVIVINAARGGLLHDEALLKGLQRGHIAAAGIDTWPEEPPHNNPFAALENVVMTPHIGASTEEAQRRIAQTVVEQTLRALRDEVVDYPVNLPKMPALNARTREYVVLAGKLGSIAAQCLNFNPAKVEVMYRGELNADEGGMVRRAFLKNFLSPAASQTLTYVNAERFAQEHGLILSESDDPGFTAYLSAIRFGIQGSQHQNLTIGGVTLGEGNHRLSLLNGFAFEIEPAGNMLCIMNADRPGVIGDIGQVLGVHGVNISQFQLSRNMPGGKAMSFIRVDTKVGEAALRELRDIHNILTVQSIYL